jgi:hypothetical protein
MMVEALTKLQRSLQTALAFLLKAQDDSGAWSDFSLPAGESNVWVTAFVGGVLAGRPETLAQQAAQASWRFLERLETAEGGWSYNPTVPCDADSTLWALRFAEALGVARSERIGRAYDFFEQQICEDGGLTTYSASAPVRGYVKLPPVIPFQGWTQSHVCVTAAGANLSAYNSRFQEYLLQRQAEDGKWAAYWWFDDEYSTAEAVTALAGKALTAADCAPHIAERIERAVEWAKQRVEKLVQADSPSAFALAQALRVLARTGKPADVQSVLRQGLTRLLEGQNADGSWAASAKLRVPRPDIIAPDALAEWTLWQGMPPGAPTIQMLLKHTFMIYSYDQQAVYTTATALRTLQELALLTE